MSQIVGYFTLRADEERAERKLQSLGGNIARHGPVAVIDDSSAETSCADDAESQVFVRFVGMLFNRTSLLGELRDVRAAPEGHPTDAELVAAAYRAFGPKAFAHLSGQFAIVLVDRARRQCLLVRDQLGAKSLHYAADGGVLWFSTGLRPLLALTGRTRVDMHRLLEFTMHGDVLPPASMFEGISTLPQGQCLTIRERDPRFELAQYFDLLALISEPTWARLSSQGADGYLAELDGHLHRSVQESLGGATSCAISLSGGLDSAILLAIAAHYTRAHAIHQSVPHGKAYDERDMAEAIAKQLGVPIDVTTVSAELYRQQLAAATFANEMPCWHVQIVGFHLLARRARELGQATLHTGDAIGGLMSASSTMPWRNLQFGIATLRRFPASMTAFLRKLGNAEAGLPIDSHGFPWGQPLAGQLLDGYARSEMSRQAEERLAFVPDPFARRVMAGRVAKIRHWWNRFYHRGERLTHEHSIGYRSPLGDLESLGFALNIPLSLLHRNRLDKWGLKELGTRYVGRQVAFQRKIAWNMPAELYFEPFATPKFFADGFCAEAFALTNDAIVNSLPGWRTTGQQFNRLVHIEVWGRLFARGERVDQVADWLASFGSAR